MRNPKRSLPQFLAELKRRRVPRSLLVYLASGFAILEAADILIPTLGFPAWALQVVVVVLVLGIPVTVVVSWAYDFTSQGLVATPSSGGPDSGSVPGPGQGSPMAARWLSPGSISLIVFFVLVGVAGGWFLEPLVRGAGQGVSEAPGPGETRPSIAFLPFENLSTSEENRFFADGIHEEVLASLSKVPDLKVIPRISVLEYRDRVEDVEAIAAELGVSNLGTGTVQRDGNQVRVRVHLIDVESGEELWGETYDRTVDDVFAIQASIARNVTNSLVTMLSPKAETQFSAAPPADSEAYLFYVRGAEGLTRAIHALDPRGLREAVESLEIALARDSSFALARAYLSVALEWSARAAENPEEKAELSRRASYEAAEALRSAPDLGEAHFAAAFQDSQTQGPEVRTQEDISHLLLAQERLPNNAAVLREMAVRYERLGRIQEAAESSERAVELVPRSALYRFQAGDHARLLGAFDAADDHLRMATALSSGAPGGLSLIFRSRFFLELARGGGKEGIQRLLSEEMDRGQVSSLALRNRLEEFPELLAGGEFDEFVASLSPEAPDPVLRCTCYELKAWAHEVGSRPEMANIYWDSLSAELQDSPTPSGNDWGETLRDVRFSLALARAGDEMRARETLEAIPIPTTRSTSEWQFLHFRAQAYASLGDAESAVEDLKVLLRSPSGVTAGTLGGRLFWEPIRNHPEFQSLTPG